MKGYTKNRYGYLLILTFFSSLWLWMGIFFTKRIRALHKETEIFSSTKGEIMREENATEALNSRDFFQDDQKNNWQIREHGSERELREKNEKSNKIIVKLGDKKGEEQSSLCGSFYCMNGEDFSELFRLFLKSQMNKIFRETRELPISSDKELDARIRKIAEERGYKRYVQLDRKNLTKYEGKEIETQVKEAFLKLKSALEERGAHLILISAYRSYEKQREIFMRHLKKILKDQHEKTLKNLSNSEIESVLKTVSIPGYSKHHTGFALDFACLNGENTKLKNFRNTRCYELLSENNFELAKRFGFIPSYPYGLLRQGPDPEPWEFVWVGNSLEEFKITKGTQKQDLSYAK